MLDQGMVPTARVAPFLRRYLEESEEPGSEAHGSLPRILKRWENEQEWAEFDSVDRIFCLISDTPVMLWLEIRDVYYACAVDACPTRIQRCARVGCANEVKQTRAKPRSGYNTKKYCSRKCGNSGHRSEQRGAKNHYGPGFRLRGMVCKHGHDLCGDNLIVTKAGVKQCRQCRRDRQRIFMRRKRAASTSRMAA